MRSRRVLGAQDLTWALLMAAARRIAEEMGAHYLPLPHADAAKISQSVSAAMKAGG